MRQRKIAAFKQSIKHMLKAGLGPTEIANRLKLDQPSLKKAIAQWRKYEGAAAWPYLRNSSFIEDARNRSVSSANQQGMVRPAKTVSAALGTPEWYVQCDERFRGRMIELGYRWSGAEG